MANMTKSSESRHIVSQNKALCFSNTKLQMLARIRKISFEQIKKLSEKNRNKTANKTENLIIRFWNGNKSSYQISLK